MPTLWPFWATREKPREHCRGSGLKLLCSCWPALGGFGSHLEHSEHCASVLKIMKGWSSGRHVSFDCSATFCLCHVPCVSMFCQLCMDAAACPRLLPHAESRRSSEAFRETRFSTAKQPTSEDCGSRNLLACWLRDLQGCDALWQYGLSSESTENSKGAHNGTNKPEGGPWDG